MIEVDWSSSVRGGSMVWDQRGSNPDQVRTGLKMLAGDNFGKFNSIFHCFTRSSLHFRRIALIQLRHWLLPTHSPFHPECDDSNWWFNGLLNHLQRIDWLINGFSSVSYWQTKESSLQFCTVAHVPFTNVHLCLNSSNFSHQISTFGPSFPPQSCYAMQYLMFGRIWERESRVYKYECLGKCSRFLQ